MSRMNSDRRRSSSSKPGGYGSPADADTGRINSESPPLGLDTAIRDVAPGCPEQIRAPSTTNPSRPRSTVVGVEVRQVVDKALPAEVERRIAQIPEARSLLEGDEQLVQVGIRVRANRLESCRCRLRGSRLAARQCWRER